MNHEVVKPAISVFVRGQVEGMRVTAEGLSIYVFPAKHGGDKGWVLVFDSLMYTHQVVSDPLSERDCLFDAG